MSGSEEDVPQQDEDFTIDTTDAGASTTFPMQAGLIRKGGHIVINGRPCKVADISTSKTGKHGHAKANIVGIDIFTDRKYEDICPTSHNVDVPHVTKREYPVLDISDDGFCSLMCDDGSTKVGPSHSCTLFVCTHITPFRFTSRLFLNH
jgi:translation initiation factor 5A